jgi:hypothetical protein
MIASVLQIAWFECIPQSLCVGNVITHATVLRVDEVMKSLPSRMD